MKVVFATGIFPPDIGGPATSVPMLAEAWSGQGHDISVVTYSDIAADGLARPYEVRRIRRGQLAWKRYADFFIALWKASAAPGPIFAQDAVASGLPALIVAFLRKRKLVLKIVGDFAWEHAQVQEGYAGSLWEFQKTPKLPMRIGWMRWLQSFVVRRAERVIVPSRCLARLVGGWGVPERRIRVIYNGADPIADTGPHVPSEATDAHRIVAVGRLVPVKKFDTLIRSVPRVMERVPDASLTLVGDGQEEGRLKALVEALGLQGRVRFVGRQTRDAIFSLMRSSGVLALTSGHEGFSYQLVEAFANGVPVVATRTGGNVELIEDGRNGLLVEVGDVEGTADAIVRMLTDRSFSARCVAEAGRDATEKFSASRQISETMTELSSAGRVNAVTGTPPAASGKRVVFATGIFPPDIGGPATSVPMLAEAWSGQGHDISVVTYSDIAADGLARPYEVRRIRRGQLAWKRYADFFIALWKASAAPGPIFAQDPVVSGLPACLVAAWRRRRMIVKVGGDFAWEHAQVQGGYRGSLEEFQKDRSVSFTFRIMRFLQRQVVLRADLLIVPSRYLAGVVRGWGVSGTRIRVIYNGVHLPKIEGVSVKRPHRIFAAGRLVPWKNFDVLIKAMPFVLERYPDASLVIAGDGPELERLESIASAPMMRGHAKFIGRLRREEVCREIASSGVFVLPSSYEGFSHQLIEAFACGACVVASRAGGNPELIEDGKNGLLVEPGDVAGLAKAILRFFDDPSLAASCAEASKEDLGRFTADTQIALTAEVVLGPMEPSVVVIGRDDSIAIPESRSAARMRMYGGYVGRLTAIAMAKRGSVTVQLAEGVKAVVVDARRAVLRPWLAVAAIRDEIRSIGADVVMAQDPFEVGLVSLIAARLEGVPIIIEEHGGMFLSPYWRRENLKNACRYPLGLLLLGAADGIRCVSRKILLDLERRFPKKPVRSIPVFTEPLTCFRQGKSSVFGYVGRFVAQKNLETLLAAFASVAKKDPEARLLMIGAGSLEEALRRQAAEYVIGDRIEWRPYSEKIADAYKDIGTLVLPSWYEGWGRVVVEAMMCGIPVVMSDVGCAGEVMRDGVEGRVVRIGDAEAFASAMLDVSDPGRHPLLSAAARRRAENVPKPETLAAELVTFWKETAKL